MFVQRNILKEK